MTSRARALAALGAYVCLVAHAAAVLHAVAVRHATCPSHGELVHGSVTGARTAEGDTARAAETGEDMDEHCLALATRRRELASLAPAPVQLLAPDALPLAILPATATSPTTLPLLHLAPKTSPPAAV
jgi:hypothetical protein